MNPTAIKIIISLASAIVVTLVLNFSETFTNSLEPLPASLVQFAIIFVGVVIASLVGPGAGAVSDDEAGSSGPAETGSVKWFNVKKGYGFITRDSGDDIFVHYRNITIKGRNNSGRRGIADGQRVRFIVIDGDKGLQADKVEII